MKSLRFLFGLGVLALTVAGGETAPPNIVLIIADDLGYSDLGYYGGEIATPHLDQLAAQGARFTQFYNNAVCNVTRTSVYTGLYPRQNTRPLLRPNTVTLAEALRAAGYATSLIGKWHLGDEAPQRPIDRGFEHSYGVLSGACNFFDPSQADPVFYTGRPNQHRLFVRDGEPVTSFPADFYTTDAIAAEAAHRIRTAVGEGRPFFVNLAYTAPHFPLQAPAEDIARQRGRYRDGYEVLRARRFARQIELGIVDPDTTELSAPDPAGSAFRYDYALTPWDELDDAERALAERRMEIYAAMVERLDHGVGEVLAALEETGAADNTIVLFFSDNGGCASLPEAGRMDEYRAYNAAASSLGAVDSYEFVGPAWGWAQNAPFRRHKVWTYEGGLCTPFIVRWPGHLAPGEIRGEIGHVIDLMPTLLAAAEADYEVVAQERSAPPMEGRNLLPVWAGEVSDVRAEPLCWELMGNRAVRDGRWKLVWGVGTQRWELYDLATDRSETRDVSTRYPARAAALAAVWEHWADRTGASR